MIDPEYGVGRGKSSGNGLRAESHRGPQREHRRVGALFPRCRVESVKAELREWKKDLASS